MRNLLSLAAALLLGSQVNAAVINSGQYNPATKKVELNVSYGGGCSQHFFELQLLGGCLETFPVQCGVTLVHTTDEPDFCEAYITEDVKLSLPANMTSDPYFERAFVTIIGSGESSILFQLPK